MLNPCLRCGIREAVEKPFKYGRRIVKIAEFCSQCEYAIKCEDKIGVRNCNLELETVEELELELEASY